MQGYTRIDFQTQITDLSPEDLQECFQGSKDFEGFLYTEIPQQNTRAYPSFHLQKGRDLSGVVYQNIGSGEQSRLGMMITCPRTFKGKICPKDLGDLLKKLSEKVKFTETSRTTETIS